MMMANGVRARPTSSSAWVRDTSVFRKIRSTTIPRSRTFRPTVSAYSLQLFLKQNRRAHTHTNTHTGTVWNETAPGRCRYLTESELTSAPCWPQSPNSQRDDRCRSAAGALRSTAGTVHYAGALLDERDQLLQKEKRVSRVPVYFNKKLKVVQSASSPGSRRPFQGST